MLILMLPGQVILLIVVLLRAIAFFLVLLPLPGNPRNRLQFHSQVQKQNLELLLQQLQKLFGFVGCWLILESFAQILLLFVVIVLVLFKLPIIQ